MSTKKGKLWLMKMDLNLLTQKILGTAHLKEGLKSTRVDDNRNALDALLGLDSHLEELLRDAEQPA